MIGVGQRIHQVHREDHKIFQSGAQRRSQNIPRLPPWCPIVRLRYIKRKETCSNKTTIEQEYMIMNAALNCGKELIHSIALFRSRSILIQLHEINMIELQLQAYKLKAYSINLSNKINNGWYSQCHTNTQRPYLDMYILSILTNENHHVQHKTCKTLNWIQNVSLRPPQLHLCCYISATM